jgi:predicted short-subunit dehydrogenase-like oxidoreductase (DUF2520 family)
MKVFLVGTGAAATTLALALRKAGVDVLGIHGRSRARAARAARRARVPGTSGPLPAAIAGADVVWIAVSDDAIPAVARQLAASGRLHRMQVVLHTAGAHGREVLRPVTRHVAAVGSLHPLQSLAEPRRAATRLAGATFAIEGTPRALRAARALALALGGRPVVVPARGKALYHAAAVMTSGGTTGLFGAAIEALVAAGVPRARAPAILLPLLQGTIENIAALGAARALTGPIARGDAATLAVHRAAIARGARRLAPLYEALVTAQVRLRRSRR